MKVKNMGEDRNHLVKDGLEGKNNMRKGGEHERFNRKRKMRRQEWQELLDEYKEIQDEFSF